MTQSMTTPIPALPRRYSPLHGTCLRRTARPCLGSRPGSTCIRCLMKTASLKTPATSSSDRSDVTGRSCGTFSRHALRLWGTRPCLHTTPPRSRPVQARFRKPGMASIKRTTAGRPSSCWLFILSGQGSLSHSRSSPATSPMSSR